MNDVYEMTPSVEARGAASEQFLLTRFLTDDSTDATNVTKHFDMRKALIAGLKP